MITNFTPIRWIRTGTIPKNPPPRNTNTCPNGNCNQSLPPVYPTSDAIQQILDEFNAKQQASEMSLAKDIAADGTPTENNTGTYWGFAGGVVAVLVLLGILWATRKMS